MAHVRGTGGASLETLKTLYESPGGRWQEMPGRPRLGSSASGFESVSFQVFSLPSLLATVILLLQDTFCGSLVSLKEP